MTASAQPYGKIYLDVIVELKPMAGHLLTVITCLMNPVTNELERSLVDLALDANMSKDSIIKYTRILEDVGHITVNHRLGGRADEVNIYSLSGVMADLNRGVS